MQGRLWPVQIKVLYPHNGTADCKCWGKGDDNLHYILKRCEDGPYIPASEYLCTRLAEAVGLPCPSGVVALLPNGEPCFGSREEGGVGSEQAALAYLQQPGHLAQFADHFMRWFAFDLFVHNEDRRIGNFLFRQGAKDVAMLGIDYSRALLTKGWPIKPPPLPPCNTVTTQREVARHITYHGPVGIELVERLRAVPDDWLDGQMRSLPGPWLDATLRQRMCRWWRTRRHQRLKLIRKHLANGRYLQLLAHSRHA